MEQVLAVFRIIEPVPGGTVVAGDSFKVTYDDSTDSIKVYKNNVLDTTPYDIGVMGTHWTFVYGISSYADNFATSVYSGCSGTTLGWFRMNTFVPSYPYFVKMTTGSSPVCSTQVCDIIFVGPIRITNSTDLTSNNGQVIALAESSNGTVKYGLTNFDYDTEGQTSGTITGLSPGDYTLYAKDANDCTAQINFRVLFQPEYLEHYRFTWRKKDIVGGTPGNPRTSRIRIYEREYAGDLVEVNYGTGSPLTINKPRQGDLDDKMFPIHPLSAALALISEFDYQFLPLFTFDNKKFKVVYEIDQDGGGFDPIATWFIVPSVYQEKFVGVPYGVSFQMGDNVVTLQDEPYADDNGNLLNGRQKLIKVIAHIMRKTGLDLNIRCGVNVFEVNHNTDPEDDPFDQTFIDVACYRKDGIPFSCWTVLESILRPFGARIYQWNNSWVIEEIDRSGAEYAYRVFDSNGDYLSNGTFDPLMDIKAPNLADRIALINSDHLLQIVPAYGRIEIISALNYVGSLITGSFEKSDLLSPESEVYNQAQAIFTSEEGFRDWTLRLNGTSGVSFGRAVTDEKSSSDFEYINESKKRFTIDNLFGGAAIAKVKDIVEYLKLTTGRRGKRSVGVFYHNHDAWSGNLREAYIESAAKPYEYGIGDRIKLSFNFLSPGSYDFEFIVLRFAIKLGDNYLQNDLSWGPTENICRAYPSPAGSFQTHEINVPAPETDLVVETTIQVRIYNYQREFYDYGSPPPAGSTNLADGDDGRDDLDEFITAGIDYDYRFDMQLDENGKYSRGFYELRFATFAESQPDRLQAGDFDDPDNPVMFFMLKKITEQRLLGDKLDRRFFIDDVAVDALINGQAPPTEVTKDLFISKYLDEVKTVTLYNFDLPDVVNAKNMYNNYFRLSDGTPTTLWTRSGINEQLALQDILLKILGGQHSAPTFKLRGSFVNEFQIIGLNNTVRLTKPGSDLVLNNTEFSSDLASWLQTGSGTAWAWNAANSGSAQVVLSGSNSSQKLYQAINHSGGYVFITVNLKIVPGATNDREDVLWLVLMNGTSIIHMEKMRIFAAPNSDTTYSFTYIAFIPGSVTGVGFFLKNINGTESCTYQMTEFDAQGQDLEEVYGIADYAFDDREDRYTLELMQLSKSYISLTGTDVGGPNQSGGEEGSAFSGAYSSAYGGSFDTVLN